MHLLEALEYLLHYLLFVDVLQNVGADDRVQVGLHLLEDQINVAVVFGADDVQELDYVFVVEFLQEHYFAEGALGVG